MKPIYKILIVSGIILIVSLGIYLGWRRFITPPTPDEQTPQVESEIQQIITSEVGVELKKLSEETVFNSWVIPGTREIYYFTPEGRVFSAKAGPDLEISQQTINALNFTQVELEAKQVLASFGDPRVPQWGIFDVIDGVWRPLPSEIVNATWGVNNDKLIAVIKNENELNLVEVDLSRNPPAYETLIRDFRLKDIKMTHIPPDRLIISEAPSASYTGRIWQLDLTTLSFNLLIAPEQGLTTIWSGDKRFAFLFGADSGFLILNDNFQIALPTPFSTLPQKCNVSASKIYCFVPQNVPLDVNLPDDYLQKKFYSIDDLFALDIESGSVERILTSNTGGFPAIDAKNVQPLDDRLYFINRYDNYLYELKLR
ncbi:MAG: hypothetical protein KJI72_02170 [Patescibacteria group bacterium]|nr:hypothetical protein [Patescibacteria group bacterium]